MAVSQTGETHGCDADRVALLNLKSRKFLDFARRQRIVRRMAQRQQRENRVHHGRINRGQSFGAFQVLEHPFARLPQRPLPQRLPRHALIELQAAIQGQKEIPPAEKLLVPLQCRAPCARVAIQSSSTRNAVRER